MLLSKLQIVELNEKDARDIIHLLSWLPVGDGAPPVIDTGRFGKVLAADWGWWRTVTGSLAKLPGLLADKPGLLGPPRGTTRWPRRGNSRTSRSRSRRGSSGSSGRTSATGSAGTSFPRRWTTSSRLFPDAA